MSSDISLSPVNTPNRQQVSNKPCHLIVFEDVSKGKVKKFVTLDRPDNHGQFVQAKGILTDLKDDEIQASYQEVLTSASKDSILELMIPTSRVFYIRSLVFKAK